jgi:hypothetical protein
MNQPARASSSESNRVTQSMSRKQPSPTEITWRVLEELEAFQGIYWREVQGEFQGAYDEVAIWILLADAADLNRAHRRLRDVVSPRFYLARFTVSYIVRMPEGEMILDFLDGNDAIERAGAFRPLGERPYLDCKGTSVFRGDPKPARPRRHVH